MDLNLGRLRNLVSDPRAAMGRAVEVAGKYINSPGVRTAGYGLAGAGASVLGNAVTGQLDDKPIERVVAEALGAGALAGGAGFGLNQLGKKANDIGLNAIDHLHSKGRYVAADMGLLGLDLANKHIAPLLPAAAALTIGPAAGGLGGVIGGSVANAAGVPQTVDPEQYQSSNSPAAIDFYARSMAQMNTPLYY